jgi:hypothetical protein
MIDIHFIREKVVLGEVHVLHVSTSHQFTDTWLKACLYSSLLIFSPAYASMNLLLRLLGGGLLDMYISRSLIVVALKSLVTIYMKATQLKGCEVFCYSLQR